MEVKKVTKEFFEQLSKGTKKANNVELKMLYNYNVSVKEGKEYFTLGNTLFRDEIEEVIKVLEEANINEFVYTDESTVALEHISTLLKNGYKAESYEIKEDIFGSINITKVVKFTK